MKYPLLLDLRSLYLFMWIWCLLVSTTALSFDRDNESVDNEFRSRIQPILTRYCDSCHSGSSPEAKLDTTLFRDAHSIASTWDSWQAIASRVLEREMPPADTSPQPDATERELLVD